MFVKNKIGKQGFEPWTPCSQSKCASQLRYFPPKFLLRKNLPTAAERPRRVDVLDPKAIVIADLFTAVEKDFLMQGLPCWLQKIYALSGCFLTWMIAVLTRSFIGASLLSPFFVSKRAITLPLQARDLPPAHPGE